MQVKIFIVPAIDESKELEEMNRFLLSRKILDIEKHLVTAQTPYQWHYAVTYIENSNPETDAKNRKKLPRVDYMLELKPAEFAIFDRLRRARKLQAEEEAVPLYIIFSNRELAQFTELPSITEEEIIKNVKGINVKRMEKFGRRFLSIYNKMTEDETQGLPVQPNN